MESSIICVELKLIPFQNQHSKCFSKQPDFSIAVHQELSRSNLTTLLLPRMLQMAIKADAKILDDPVLSVDDRASPLDAIGTFLSLAVPVGQNH